MGFTIFESSGTFNPIDHGLNVGDLIHIVAVGGGGGGCGTSNLYNAGTAGSASSFGNILTAEGGLAPSDNKPIAPTSGSCMGAVGGYSTYVDKYAGYGADGWLPGVCRGRNGISSWDIAHTILKGVATAGGFPVSDSEGRIVNWGCKDALVSAIPSSPLRAGSGGIYVERDDLTYCMGGAGGLGYGAGGGGGACSYTGSNKAGAGGNSGVIAQKEHILTSTSPVAVTVGTGGAGGTGYAGGKGADGCVAIFW